MQFSLEAPADEARILVRKSLFHISDTDQWISLPWISGQFARAQFRVVFLGSRSCLFFQLVHIYKLPLIDEVFCLEKPQSSVSFRSPCMPVQVPKMPCALGFLLMIRGKWMSSSALCSARPVHRPHSGEECQLLSENDPCSNIFYTSLYYTPYGSPFALVIEGDWSFYYWQKMMDWWSISSAANKNIWAPH